MLRDITLGTSMMDLRQQRTTIRNALAATTYDILVVGGGITGAGIARDAALRGLKVALVDKSDFG